MQRVPYRDQPRIVEYANIINVIRECRTSKTPYNGVLQENTAAGTENVIQPSDEYARKQDVNPCDSV